MHDRAVWPLRRLRLIALAVIAGPVIGGLNAGCSGSGSPVEFVLPDGYTGPVILVLDTKDGSDILLHDSIYRIVIPPDGRLRVKTHDPFHRWHQETWRYANGAVIPKADLIQNPDPNSVMVWGSSAAVSESVRWMEHYVGTESQWDQYVRSPRPNPN